MNGRNRSGHFLGILFAVGKKTGREGTAPPAAHGERADEALLIRRCRAGERQAQEELYRRYRRQVGGNLYRVLGRRDDLDDLVQEVFAIAFRGLDRFRGEARLGTWLYRICINVALASIRARTRRPPPLPLGQAVLEAGDGAARAVGNPETALSAKQDRERVYRALEAMSPKKRIVLYLHEIEGLDLVEISAIVKAHPVTVRTRLFYGRREFYRLIAEDPAGSGGPGAFGEREDGGDP